MREREGCHILAVWPGEPTDRIVHGSQRQTQLKANFTLACVPSATSFQSQLMTLCRGLPFPFYKVMKTWEICKGRNLKEEIIKESSISILLE